MLHIILHIIGRPLVFTVSEPAGSDLRLRQLLLQTRGIFSVADGQ